MDKNEFVKRLKTEMIENELKPKDLAEKTSIPLATIQAYLNPNRDVMPPYDRLEVIAKALKKNTSYFLDGETKQAAEPTAHYAVLSEIEVLKMLWKYVFKEEFHTNKTYIGTKLKEIGLV